MTRRVRDKRVCSFGLTSSSGQKLLPFCWRLFWRGDGKRRGYIVGTTTDDVIKQVDVARCVLQCKEETAAFGINVVLFFTVPVKFTINLTECPSIQDRGVPFGFR